MGDRITTYRNCPVCKGKETFECYEALSCLTKIDQCTACGYAVYYEMDDNGDVITIKKLGERWGTNWKFDGQIHWRVK
jgi:hypothetical protein